MFVVTILFMVWYFFYVMAAVFARDAMRHLLIGDVNVALVFGAPVRRDLPARPALRRYSREVLAPRLADAERPAVAQGER